MSMFSGKSKKTIFSLKFSDVESKLSTLWDSLSILSPNDTSDGKLMEFLEAFLLFPHESLSTPIQGHPTDLVHKLCINFLSCIYLENIETGEWLKSEQFLSLEQKEIQIDLHNYRIHIHTPLLNQHKNNIIRKNSNTNSKLDLSNGIDFLFVSDNISPPTLNSSSSSSTPSSSLPLLHQVDRRFLLLSHTIAKLSSWEHNRELIISLFGHSIFILISISVLSVLEKLDFLINIIDELYPSRNINSSPSNNTLSGSASSSNLTSMPSSNNLFASPSALPNNSLTFHSLRLLRLHVRYLISLCISFVQFLSTIGPKDEWLSIMMGSDSCPSTSIRSLSKLDINILLLSPSRCQFHNELNPYKYTDIQENCLQTVNPSIQSEVDDEWDLEYFNESYPWVETVVSLELFQKLQKIKPSSKKKIRSERTYSFLIPSLIAILHKVYSFSNKISIIYRRCKNLTNFTSNFPIFYTKELRRRRINSLLVIFGNETLLNCTKILNSRPTVVSIFCFLEVSSILQAFCQLRDTDLYINSSNGINPNTGSNANFHLQSTQLSQNDMITKFENFIFSRTILCIHLQDVILRSSYSLRVANNLTTITYSIEMIPHLPPFPPMNTLSEGIFPTNIDLDSVVNDFSLTLKSIKPQILYFIETIKRDLLLTRQKELNKLKIENDSGTSNYQSTSEFAYANIQLPSSDFDLISQWDEKSQNGVNLPFCDLSPYTNSQSSNFPSVAMFREEMSNPPIFNYDSALTTPLLKHWRSRQYFFPSHHSHIFEKTKSYIGSILETKVMSKVDRLYSSKVTDAQDPIFILQRIQGVKKMTHFFIILNSILWRLIEFDENLIELQGNTIDPHAPIPSYQTMFFEIVQSTVLGIIKLNGINNLSSLSLGLTNLFFFSCAFKERPFHVLQACKKLNFWKDWFSIILSERKDDFKLDYMTQYYFMQNSSLNSSSTETTIETTQSVDSTGEENDKTSRPSSINKQPHGFSSTFLKYRFLLTDISLELLWLISSYKHLPFIKGMNELTRKNTNQKGSLPPQEDDSNTSTVTPNNIILSSKEEYALVNNLSPNISDINLLLSYRWLLNLCNLHANMGISGDSLLIWTETIRKSISLLRLITENNLSNKRVFFSPLKTSILRLLSKVMYDIHYSQWLNVFLSSSSNQIEPLLSSNFEKENAKYGKITRHLVFFKLALDKQTSLLSIPLIIKLLYSCIEHINYTKTNTTSISSGKSVASSSSSSSDQFSPTIITYCEALAHDILKCIINIVKNFSIQSVDEFTHVSSERDVQNASISLLHGLVLLLRNPTIFEWKGNYVPSDFEVSLSIGSNEVRRIILSYGPAYSIHRQGFSWTHSRPSISKDILLCLESGYLSSNYIPPIQLHGNTSSNNNLNLFDSIDELTPQLSPVAHLSLISPSSIIPYTPPNIGSQIILPSVIAFLTSIQSETSVDSFLSLISTPSSRRRRPQAPIRSLLEYQHKLYHRINSSFSSCNPRYCNYSLTDIQVEGILNHDVSYLILLSNGLNKSILQYIELFFEMLLGSKEDLSQFSAVFKYEFDHFDSNNVPKFSNLFNFPPPLIKNPCALVSLLPLLPFFPPKFQILTFEGILSLIPSLSSSLILNTSPSSSLNLTTLTTCPSSLAHVTLDAFPYLHPWTRSIALKFLQILGRHSLSGAELKRALGVLEKEVYDEKLESYCCLCEEYWYEKDERNNKMVFKGIGPLTDSIGGSYFVDLLQGTLNESEDPQFYFMFEGLKCGIKLPPFRLWPANNGFSFCFWFSIKALKSDLAKKNSLKNHHNNRGFFMRTLTSTQSITNEYLNQPNVRSDKSTKKSKIMMLISVRQQNGVGFEMFLQSRSLPSNSEIMKILQVWAIIYRVYYVKGNNLFHSDLHLFDLTVVDSHGKGLVYPPNVLYNTSFNPVSNDYSPKSWHFISLSHLKSRMFLQKSTLNIMVDSHTSKHDLTFPRFQNSNSSEIYGGIGFRNSNDESELDQYVFDSSSDNSNCILTNNCILNPTKLDFVSENSEFEEEETDYNITCAFQGRMSAIYFFHDALLFRTMKMIYSLGCTRLNEIASHSEEWKNLGFDSPLSHILMLAYNPGIHDTTHVIESSEFPSSKWSPLVSTELQNSIELNLERKSLMNGEFLNGTHVSTSRDMRNALDCLGGPQVLLPTLVSLIKKQNILVSNNKSLLSNSDEVCEQYLPPMFIGKRFSEILNLFSLLLRNTSDSKRFMISSGTSSLRYFLNQLKPKGLIPSIVDSLFEISVKFQNNLPKMTDNHDNIENFSIFFISYVLFDSLLWILAPFESQEAIFRRISKLALTNSDLLKKEIGIQFFFDLLYSVYSGSYFPDRFDKLLYSYSNTDDSSFLVRGLFSFYSSRKSFDKNDNLSYFDQLSNAQQLYLEHYQSNFSLSKIELIQIRELIFNIIYFIFIHSNPTESFDTEILSLLNYLSQETDGEFIIEGLQFLIRLINPDKCDFSARILSSLCSHKCLLVLSELHSHPRTKVRVYSWIVTCSILHLAYTAYCGNSSQSSSSISSYALAMRSESRNSTASNGQEIETSNNTFQTQNSIPENDVYINKQAIIQMNPMKWSLNIINTISDNNPSNQLSQTPRAGERKRTRSESYYNSIIGSPPPISTSTSEIIPENSDETFVASPSATPTTTSNTNSSQIITSTVDVFEALGVGQVTLWAWLMNLVYKTEEAADSQIFHDENAFIEDHSSSIISLQFDIIYFALYCLLYGLPCKHLLPWAEKIPLSDTKLEGPDTKTEEIPSPIGTLFEFFYGDSLTVNEAITSLGLSNGINQSSTISSISTSGLNYIQMRFCFPMVIPSLMILLKPRLMIPTSRSIVSVKFLRDLIGCENIELFAALPKWQALVLDVISAEDSSEVSNSISEMFIKLFSEIHLHIIFFGEVSQVKIRFEPPRKAFRMSYFDASSNGILNLLMKESRVLGCAALRKSIAYIRAYRDSGWFENISNIKDSPIGIKILQSVLDHLKFGLEFLQKSTETNEEKERKIRYRLIEVNLWMVVDAISEFIVSSSLYINEDPQIKKSPYPQHIAFSPKKSIYNSDKNLRFYESEASLTQEFRNRLDSTVLEDDDLLSRSNSSVDATDHLIYSFGKDSSLSPNKFSPHSKNSIKHSSTDNFSHLPAFTSIIESILSILSLTDPNFDSFDTNDTLKKIENGIKVGINKGRYVVQLVQDSVDSIFNFDTDAISQSSLPINQSPIMSPQNSTASTKTIAKTNSKQALNRAVSHSLWSLLSTLIQFISKYFPISSDDKFSYSLFNLPSNVAIFITRSLEQIEKVLSFSKKINKEIYEDASLFVFSKLITLLPPEQSIPSTPWINILFALLTNIIVSNKAIIKSIYKRFVNGDRSYNLRGDSNQELNQSSNISISNSSVSTNSNPSIRRFSLTPAALGLALLSNQPPVQHLEPISNNQPASPMPRLISKTFSFSHLINDNNEFFMKDIITPVLNEALDISSSSSSDSKLKNNGTYTAWGQYFFLFQYILDCINMQYSNLLNNTFGMDSNLIKHSNEILKKLDSYYRLINEAAAHYTQQSNEILIKFSKFLISSSSELINGCLNITNSTQDSWNKLYSELSNERGAWGCNDISNDKVLWLLSFTEEDSRMMRKLIRGDFDKDYLPNFIYNHNKQCNNTTSGSNKSEDASIVDSPLEIQTNEISIGNNESNTPLSQSTMSSRSSSITYSIEQIEANGLDLLVNAVGGGQNSSNTSSFQNSGSDTALNISIWKDLHQYRGEGHSISYIPQDELDEDYDNDLNNNTETDTKNQKNPTTESSRLSLIKDNLISSKKRSTIKNINGSSMHSNLFSSIITYDYNSNFQSFPEHIYGNNLDIKSGSIKVKSKLSYEREENVIFQCPCEVIIPSTNSSNLPSSGLLQLTKQKLQFIKLSDIPVSARPACFLEGGEYSPNVRSMTTKYLNSTITSPAEYLWACQPFPSTEWDCIDITNVLQRYYRLRFVAVEIFTSNRQVIFFNLFDSKVASRFQAILRRVVRPPFMAPFLGKNPSTILASYTVPGTGQALQIAWANREITNFEYLMRLNTIAGRTFNDLGQYPIFPWIIADYVSDTLDLKNKKTFRNLKWPIGAQDENQRKTIISRYNELMQVYDPNDETSLPPFHYGTHYSVAGFVLWYLIRLEPYTSLHVQLQDGRIDRADRLFDSIASAWKGCTTNSSDAKELIPEMFYCPEILENVNNIDFGTTQCNRKIDKVKLPPWANGCPYEFIRLHKEALESEYVSRNLHHWIDLIFGYKQRPPHLGGSEASVESCNVFFHLTYEHAVDLEKLRVSNPSLYNQYLCQITEFGQTPTQIFTKEHIARQPLTEVDIIWPIASVVRGIDTISDEEQRAKIGMPRKMLCFKTAQVSISPIILIIEDEDRIITLDHSRILGIHFWQIISTDAVPPFKFKPDPLSLDYSKGNVVNHSSIGFTNKNQNKFNKKIGVPFATSILKNSLSSYQRKLSIIENALGERNEGKFKWRPIKSKIYEREDKILNKSTLNYLKNDISYDDDSTKSSKNSNYTRKRAPTISQTTPNQSSTSQSSSLPSGAFQYYNNHVQDDHISSQNFAYLSKNRLLISCGHWDWSVRVTSVDTGKLMHSLVHHNDVVTCLSLARNFGQQYLITGSRDCTVVIWEITSLDKTGLNVSITPIRTLYGHDDAINCIAVNPELDLVLSGSDDGTIIAHNLRNGKYIRTIINREVPRFVSTQPLTSNQIKFFESNTNINRFSPKEDEISLSNSNCTTPTSFNLMSTPSSVLSSSSTGTSASNSSSNSNSSTSSSNYISRDSNWKVNWIGISKEGYIVTYSKEQRRLCTFSLNGTFLHSHKTPEALYTLLLSDDGKVLITGGSACLVVFRWVHNLELANDGPRKNLEAILDGHTSEFQQEVFNSPIRSLILTKQERHLIIGLETGQIRILAHDSEYLRQRLHRKLQELGFL